MYYELVSAFHSKGMHSIEKRSLLPFIGKVFGSIIGTATETDVNMIKSHLHDLQNSQSSLVHIVDNSLSILNITTTNVGVNRHRLNELTDIVSHLNIKVSNLSRAFYETVVPMKSFVIAIARFNFFIERSITWLNIADEYISDFKMQLNQLSLGHLSPLIFPPDDLVNLNT